MYRHLAHQLNGCLLFQPELYYIKDLKCLKMIGLAMQDKGLDRLDLKYSCINSVVIKIDRQPSCVWLVFFEK